MICTYNDCMFVWGIITMRKHFRGILQNSKSRKQVTVSVDLICFQEEDIFYYYSPALDLMGYGYTPEEAKASWEVVLEEYVSYVMNKQTLEQDLVSRGWKLQRRNKTFAPPSFSYLLQHNEQLQEMYNKHDFHKTTHAISLPAFA